MNKMQSIRKDWKLIESLISKNAKVLDIGCGEGGLIVQLEKNIQAKTNGIELNPELTRKACLLYTSPSPRDKRQSRMPSSA